MFRTVSHGQRQSDRRLEHMRNRTQVQHGDTSSHAALSYIAGLLLFSLQGDPTPNTTELQDALKREKKRIELLEVERRRQHVQRRITDFLGPSGTSSSLS